MVREMRKNRDNKRPGGGMGADFVKLGTKLAGLINCSEIHSQTNAVEQTANQTKAAINKNSCRGLSPTNTVKQKQQRP